MPKRTISDELALHTIHRILDETDDWSDAWDVIPELISMTGREIRNPDEVEDPELDAWTIARDAGVWGKHAEEAE
jgi:hypothetical protein